MKQFTYNDQLFNLLIGSGGKWGGSGTAYIFGSSDAFFVGSTGTDALVRDDGNGIGSFASNEWLEVGSAFISQVSVDSKWAVTDAISIGFGSGASTVAFTGGSEADYITIGGSATKVSIDAGAGQDSINVSGGSGIYIDGGSDADYITIGGSASGVTIKAGTDDVISLGSGLGSDAVTFTGGEGSVADYDWDNDVFTYGGATIQGVSAGTTIGGVAFDKNQPSVYTEKNLSIMDANNFTSLANNVSLTTYDSVVSTGDGDDTIYVGSATGVSIDAGSGADKISVIAGTATVNGGAGDDSIYLGSGASVQVVVGSNDGNDYIVGFSEGDTLILNGSVGGSDVDGNYVVSVGDGKVTLEGVTSSNLSGLGTGTIVYSNAGDASLGSDEAGSTENVVDDDAVGTDSLSAADAVSESRLGVSIEGSESYTVGDLTSGSLNIALDADGNLVVGSGSISDDEAVADVTASLASDGTLVLDYTGRESATEDDELSFVGGTGVSTVNGDFTKSSGNFDVTFGNIKAGNFEFSEESNIFAKFAGLKDGAQITVAGGAQDSNPSSGNTFYAPTTANDTVASAADQAVVTITDISFNASDVLMVDAGIANLTKDFFDTGKFFNYANGSAAADSKVYAGTVFDASALVEKAGMSFSMLQMANGSASLDDENHVDESEIVNVVWANSGSAAEIDFSNQTGEVLLFTNTNSFGDGVTLGGEFNDTIYAGANDTIYAGDGDDLITVEDGANGKNAVINAGAGNDTIVAGRATTILFNADDSGDDVITNFVAGTTSKSDTIAVTGSIDLNTAVSLNGDGELVISTDNGTATFSGSEAFTGSTSFQLDIDGTSGVGRVADASGNVYYNKDVDVYVGTGSATVNVTGGKSATVDLSNGYYYGITNIDASTATGKVELSGNSSDNVLTGGAKASTLWGGGGNDTLIGGSGKDTFVFTASDGNVTIQNGDSNDVVDMTAFTVDDIAGYEFTSDGLVVTTNNDQTLQVSGVTTFSLSGATFTADYDNQTIS